MPSSRASSRVEASRDPDGKRPARIALRSARYVCRGSEPRPSSSSGGMANWYHQFGIMWSFHGIGRAGIGRPWEDTHMATDLERFFEYARAFEMAYVADLWAGLEGSFTDDARH